MTLDDAQVHVTRHGAVQDGDGVPLTPRQRVARMLLVLIAFLLVPALQGTFDAVRKHPEDPSRSESPRAKLKPTVDASILRRVVGYGRVVSEIRANSAISDRAGGLNAFDGNPDSYWHVAQNRELRSSDWVYVRLEGKQRRSIDLVRMKPRQANPDQFMETALLQGSNDGLEWQDIAVLNFPAPAKTSDWVNWTIPPSKPFAYFRFYFPQGEMTGWFWSLAEIELYQPDEFVTAEAAVPEPLPPNATRIPLSGKPDSASVNTVLRNMDANSLFDGNGASFWHADPADLERGMTPRLEIDLGKGAATAVNFLRFQARRDVPEQMFGTILVRGSHDGTSWEDVTAIERNSIQTPAEGFPWQGWRFPNETAFRFYRFDFLSGFAGPNAWFMSLAELQLYRVD